MNDYITNELIETTYFFCLKRISDTEAAKDLSQDILYEALRVIASGKQFVSFYSWYWKMARNKYADYISNKQNNILPIEMAGGMMSELPQPIESIIAAEDISRLNFALSRLASIHREIIVRFYLKEQSIKQIANELAIPEGTVKRRMFDAKKNLKERFDTMNNIGKTSYALANVNYFVGFSARKAVNLMESSKICPQVMLLYKDEAKTVNEIADEIGVAPVYLEEILEKMVKEYLLVSPTNGKYLTNWCAFPNEAYAKAEVYAIKAFHDGGFAKRVCSKLVELKDKIQALDFYGNHFDYNYLMWILCSLAGDATGVNGREHYLAKYKGKIANEAERKYRMTIIYTLSDEEFDNSIYSDVKAVGWSNLHQTFHTSEYGVLEYINDFEAPPFPVERNDEDDWRCGRDLWVDGNNISLLVSLSKNPQKILSVHEEALAAEFLRRGLLKKENNKLVVQLPIMKLEVYKEINKIILDALKEISDEFANVIGTEVEKILLPYVRRDLLSNFIYWDMRTFFQTISSLFWEARKNYLAEPEDYSTSAAGLYILMCS